MRNDAEKAPVLALDLGGTKILAALVSRDGKIMAKERDATPAGDGLEAVVERLFAVADRLMERNNLVPRQLHSISIAAAGGIDSRRGVVTLSPNLPGWHDVPLRDIVRDRYQTRTFLINDASAAALGEHRFGAGAGAKNMVLLTVGTGIGGGIIVDGALYQGADGCAGELGHMTIDVNGAKCLCGSTGCLETLASGTAMVREAMTRIEQGEPSLLKEMARGDLGGVTGEMVERAAKQGDALARDVISHIAFYLGVGMVNLVNIFNPEMIVVGGGVATLGDLLLEPACKLVKERAFPLAAETVRIVTARLGNEAGLYGAAAYAFGGK